MATKLVIFKNVTRQTVLGARIKKADNVFTRFLGLLPRKHLEPGEGLWLVPCKDIHSIGMQFRFDALFLDKDLKVVHMIEDMKPLRISKLVREAKTVLELPSGHIKETQTHLGDQLAVEE